MWLSVQTNWHAHRSPILLKKEIKKRKKEQLVWETMCDGEQHQAFASSASGRLQLRTVLVGTS